MRNIMKKHLNRLTDTIIYLLLAAVLICTIGAHQVNAAEVEPSATIKKKTMYVGYNTYKLKFKNLAEDAKLHFKSSEPEVAKVSATGKITPIATGNTKISITISQNGKKYSSSVTITVKEPYVELIGIDDVIERDKPYSLKAKTYGLKQFELTYSVVNSDDKDDEIASIDLDKLILVGNRLGNITLTVTEVISGLSASKNIKIVDKIDETESLVRYTDKGSYVLFGYYPQTEIKGKALTSKIKNAKYDNETNTAVINDIKIYRLDKNTLFMPDDGKWYDNYRYFKFEPIKWKVMSRSDKELVLLSEYALIAWQYDKKDKGAVWKDSYIRGRLNGYDQGKKMDYNIKTAFANLAFTQAERYVMNTKNVDGVKDKVYLLSFEEAKKTSYGFSSSANKSSSRICYITEFADASGARGSASEGTWWWLRTTANKSTVLGDGGAMAVYGGGKIETGGLKNGIADNGVRPVISINLKAENIKSKK